MQQFETDKLIFKLDSEGKWWAVDDDNVEYCVQPSFYDQDQWTATMQRRLAFDSVSENIGAFYDFEEACYACDNVDTSGLFM